MALDRLTQITSSGISSTSTITVSAVAGIVTATTLTVTGDSTATNINASGIVTATGGVVGAVTGNLTGNVSSTGANTLGSLSVTNDATVGGALTVTGNLTVNGTTTTIDTAVTAVDSLAIDGDASVGGALTATGNITANAFYGDGSNLTGIDATQIQTGNTSVQTVDTGSDGHIKFNTEGTERLRISANGNVTVDANTFFVDAVNNRVSVGTTSPTATLHIAGGTERPALYMYGSNKDIGYNSVLQFGEWDGTTYTERMRIDSSGRLLVGTVSAIETTSTSSVVQAATSVGAYFIAARNDTEISEGNSFGGMRFYGNDSDGNYDECARIQVQADGAHSNDSKPTRLMFWTTADSLSSPTERLRITSSGNVGIGTDNPTTKLVVQGDWVSSTGQLRIKPSSAGQTLSGFTFGTQDNTLLATNYSNSSTGNLYFQNNTESGNIIFTGPTLEHFRITSSGEVRVPDNGKFTCGTDDDTELYFDGVDTIIDHTSPSGTLRLRGDAIALQTTQATPETYISCNADSSVQLYHNNSEKLATTSNGISVTGQIDVGTTSILSNGDISMGDNDLLRLGAGDDLRIYHDGTHSYIKNDTNELKIMSNDLRLQNNAGNANYLRGIAGGALILYYNNSEKFTTTSSGIEVTGSVTCDGLTSAGNIELSSGFGTLYVKDSNSTGTASQAQVAFQTSDNTVLGQIGYIDSANSSLYIKNASSGYGVIFQTSSTDRCQVDGNGHFRPVVNNTYDLGTSSYRWRNIYTNDLNLSNEGGANDVDGTWGNYTIQEGEEDLFLINRRSGKKYKFMLEEVN